MSAIRPAAIVLRTNAAWRHAGIAHVGRVGRRARDLERAVDAVDRGADGGHAVRSSSIRMIVRSASGTLNAVPGDRERVGDRGLGRGREDARIGRGAEQDGLGRAAHATGSCRRRRAPASRPRSLAVLDHQRRRDRHERELVGRAVAHLEVAGTRDARQQRDLDRGDQLALGEHVLHVRVARPGARRTRSAARAARRPVPGCAPSRRARPARRTGRRRAARCSARSRRGSRASWPLPRPRRNPTPARACCRPRPPGRGSSGSACAAAGCRRSSPCCAAATDALSSSASRTSGSRSATVASAASSSIVVRAPTRSDDSPRAMPRSGSRVMSTRRSRLDDAVLEHQVDLRRAAGQVRRVRVVADEPDGLGGVARACVGERPHRYAPCPCATSRIAATDVRVRPAAAEVAAHELLDLLVRARSALREQGHGGQDLARRAAPALKGVVADERLLHRMQAAVVAGQPFDRRDRAAVALRRERQARHDALAVEQHRARAAGALIAALLRAGQPELVAQRVEQRDAGIELQPVRPPVDLEACTISSAPHSRPATATGRAPARRRSRRRTAAAARGSGCSRRGSSARAPRPRRARPAARPSA